ncbi:MAG: hypothetical protein NZ739_07485 [Verrucomicrobiae bacterium]|nr:hypothetical protein [Verrucomicrobiae bacterium]
MRPKLFLFICVAGVALAARVTSGVEPEGSLPPVDLILRRVAERAEKEDENDQAFNQTYSYTRTRTTEIRNAKGELKKTESKVSVHEPRMAGPPTSQVRPPARMHSPKDTAESSRASDSDSRMRGRVFDRRALKLDAELLDRFLFSVVGKDTVNGRATFVLEFRPKPGKLPERSFRDKFINKAAGRAWVDTEDYALVKAELYLTDTVEVVAGLASAVWELQYMFEREQTPEGLWFTRRVRWHLEGREVLVRRIVDYFEERTNVCKVE